MSEQAKPEIDPTMGDFFGPLQQPLSQEIMQAMLRLPAVLEAGVEGAEGAVSIPPEQMAEANEATLRILMNHVPKIAGALDVTRARLTRLEAQLEGLAGPRGAE